MRLRGGAAVAVACLAGALAPAVAEGAIRLAVPAGGQGAGPCTTPATACTLPVALQAAVNGDTVRLAAGTYLVGNGPNPVNTAITIEGDPAAARPLLVGTAGGPGDWVLYFTGGVGVQQTLRRLELRQTGSANAYALATGAQGLVTGEDLLISGTGIAANLAGNVVLRDSVVRTSGAGSPAVQVGAGSNAQVRNVTAAGGIGLQVTGSVFGDAVANVRSSALQGSITDVRATGVSGEPALVLLDHSAFDATQPQSFGTIDTSAGGNVTAAPLFTDAVNANFRPLAGSPTIDAGVADSFSGTKDPDGNARTLGAAPDIGAFEFVPPAGPPPGPPASAPVNPAADTSAPAVTLAGLPRRVTASALRRGVKVRVTTSEAARLALTLTARKRGGAFLSARRKPRTTTVTLGRASAPAGAATRTITLKAARRALGRATRLKATITVVATDAAGNAARRTATLAVAPARRR